MKATWLDLNSLNMNERCENIIKFLPNLSRKAEKVLAAERRNFAPNSVIMP